MKNLRIEQAWEIDDYQRNKAIQKYEPEPIPQYKQKRHNQQWGNPMEDEDDFDS